MARKKILLGTSVMLMAATCISRSEEASSKPSRDVTSAPEERKNGSKTNQPR